MRSTVASDRISSTHWRQVHVDKELCNAFWAGAEFYAAANDLDPAAPP